MSIIVTQSTAPATRPIRRINTGLHQPVKRRMRPIRDAPDQPVFHRIEMHIIHMRLHVRIVTYEMLNYRLCQMPRSPRAARTADRRSTFGSALENPILISRQRMA